MEDKHMELARFILAHIGGAENVLELTHCVSRVRFYLKDEARVREEELLKHDHIFAIYKVADQFQILVGTQVHDVFNGICKLANKKGSVPWYEK